MEFFSDLVEYLEINYSTVLEALRDHLYIGLVPVVIAFVLSLPLGFLVVRYGWLRVPLLTLSSVLYTIPSLALILVIPGILSTNILDPNNVVIALTIYGLALLVRTTADGLSSIDPLIVQAATAMGYKPVRRWFAVDLPLALPVVLSGLRVATVASVSMASIAALVGIGGLGQLFTRGFQLGFYPPPIVIGLVLSVALAVVADLVIVLVQRAVTPWTRLRQGA
ncbi:ABC transporter permease [uncultured Nocardioides sp.]|uniref:ABC transporter permease n=1 Tax=uncultured Nocardioides sp. TaxID=198441 RepID=UPI00262DB2A8|nr:ABC transporter permease [uncultured Nocardioides sp.]